MKIHHNMNQDSWRITMVDTGEKAMKGARIKRLQKFIPDDTFMVTYGDGVADIDIKALVAFHHKHGRIATVTGINPAARFGELKLDGDIVVNFREKHLDDGGLANGGFFVFNKEIFNYLSLEDDCDLEIGPLERIAEIRQLMVYRHPGFWACMDTLRDMDYLNNLWEQEQALWKIW